MASEGGGKIKGKRNQTSSKPYDRNSSLLGKLKDHVKGLLVPSWLSSPSLSSGSQKDDSGEDRQTSTLKSNSLTTSNAVEFSKTDKSTDYGSTKELDDSGVVTFPKLNRQERQNSFGETYPSTSLEPPPPNVNIATFYQGDGRNSNNSDQQKSYKTQRPMEMNETPDWLRMLDSIADESNNQATETRPIMIFTKASSGTPSSEAAAKRQRLWSPESARQGKPFVAPVTERPSFNTSLFGAMNQSNSSLRGNRSHESSFYSGKTQYGGAAAIRKTSLPPSPYQSSLPIRKQVKANSLNTSLNATTSATAQRILETLDRMSTPLGDAKKIPQNELNDSVLSFTPSSYRRASYLTSGRSATRPLQLPNAGAPKYQHQSISKAVIAKNRNKFHIDNTQQSSFLQNTYEDVDLHSDSSRLPTSMEPALSRLSNEGVGRNASSSSGKMKEKRFSQHISSRGKEDEEVVEVPNLRTDFTLPITNFNPISLHTVSVKSHSVASSSIPTSEKSAPLKFTFSTPIEAMRKSGNNFMVANVDKGFQFSSPINASNVKSNAAGAEEGSKTSPEPAVGASSVVSTSFSSSVPVWGSTAPRPKVADIGGTSSSFKTYNKWPENDSSAASDVVTATGFSLAPASSLKTGSVMDILGKEDSMLKFKKAPGSWECDSCMLVNKPEASKCIACETPKPGVKQAAVISPVTSAIAPPVGDDLMSKLKKPPGTWECQTCLVQNKPEAAKCVSCETSRPGSNQSTPSSASSSSTSLNSLFKKPVGTWECDTCMVQNIAAALKCAACESPKPGLEAAGVVSKAAVTSKASAITISPEGGFYINVPTTTTTTVGSGGFKFGNSAPTTTSSTASSGGFKFVNAAPTTTSSTASSGGFKFVNAAPTTTSSTASSGGFKFVNAAPTTTSSIASSGGFKFGDVASTSASTAVSTGGFKFGDSAHSTSSAVSSGGFQFGISTTSKDSSDTSANNVSVAQTGGFKFGNSNTQSSGIAAQTTEAKSSGGFVFGSLTSEASTSKPNLQFGVAAAAKISQNEPTENHSLFNGVPGVKSNPESGAFLFGNLASSSASITTQDKSSTLAGTDSTLKVLQVNFNNANSAANSPTPTFALSTSQSLVGNTGPKSANSLFQFGVTPAVSSSAGLGMNSLDNNKPLTNGGFGVGISVLPSQPKTSDGASTLAASTFGGFGQTSSAAVAQPVKRSVDLDEDAPVAKKTVHFGSINSEASTNGLFTFGAPNMKTSAFGTNASGAANPSGGFLFGSTSNVQPVQTNASQGAGFQFGFGSVAPATTNIFSVNAATDPAKAAADIKSSTVIPASFNFGGSSQQSAAPYKFGAPSTDPQTSSSPFLFGSTTATNPPTTGSFNIGAGDPGRRKIKAVRKLKK